jgi:hypothetical protein
LLGLLMVMLSWRPSLMQRAAPVGQVLRRLGAAFVDDLQGEVLVVGEQGAEFFALSNRGWYSASSAGLRRRRTFAPSSAMARPFW